MRVYFGRSRTLSKLSVVCLVLLCCILPCFNISVVSAVNFNNNGFSATWNKLDKPVEDGTVKDRGYTWGPVVKGSGKISNESYNGLTRKVQYFDKARMEVNNLCGNPNDPYYVTTGLLVKELVSGKRQDGDDRFTELQPSKIQVAGDPNDGQGNPNAPTYASFKVVSTISDGENFKATATGQVISDQLNKDGTVSKLVPPEKRVLDNYDAVTHHNIADVFVTFGKQSGLVWNGQTTVQAPLFGSDATYVLGRPISEPYWVKTLVAGQEKSVLVQLFERRSLTYTPTNPDNFKIEMGNVGQHYFRWRYDVNRQAPLPKVDVRAVSDLKQVPFNGRGTLSEQIFYSRALNRNMPYEIYLPPDYYSSNKRYPVVYLLHGLNGDYRSWQSYGVMDKADGLMVAGKIQSFIIVTPNGENGYWLNHAGCGPRWGDYIVNDLVGYIDANYRTVSDMQSRAIGGISMGGHGALQLSFNNPTVFGIIGAHSPAFRTKEQAFDFWGDANYYATIDPITLVNTKELGDYKIWLDIGSEDKDWLPRATEMHQVLASHNIAHTWNVWPGGHTSDYWSAHVVDYLNFYSNAFPR